MIVSNQHSRETKKGSGLYADHSTIHTHHTPTGTEHRYEKEYGKGCLHFNDVRDIGGGILGTAVNATPRRGAARVIALPVAQLSPGIGLSSFKRQ